MITFYFLGKTDDYRKQILDYIKRIEQFTSVKVVEATVSKFEKEISSLGFWVLLDERGKLFTSLQFSQFLQEHNEITFVFGPAEGTSEMIKKKASFLLGLSPMTLQHDLARLVCLEQIYRGFSILKKLPYHK